MASMKRSKFLFCLFTLSFFVNISPMENNPQKMNWCMSFLKCYGLAQLGILTHELGHWSVGKKLYGCKGLIVLFPPLGGGTLLYYNGPVLKKTVYDFLGKDHKHLAVNLVEITGYKGVSVFLAGPLFGLSYSLALPIINTFYNEYKNEKSLKLATQKTIQQSYFNSKQESAVQFAAILGTLQNLINLIPYEKGNDGYRILECLKLQSGKIRWPISGLLSISMLTAGVLIATGPNVKESKVIQSFLEFCGKKTKKNSFD